MQECEECGGVRFARALALCPINTWEHLLIINSINCSQKDIKTCRTPMCFVFTGALWDLAHSSLKLAMSSLIHCRRPSFYLLLLLHYPVGKRYSVKGWWSHKNADQKGQSDDAKPNSLIYYLLLSFSPLLSVSSSFSILKQFKANVLLRCFSLAFWDTKVWGFVETLSVHSGLFTPRQAVWKKPAG